MRTSTVHATAATAAATVSENSSSSFWRRLTARPPAKRRPGPGQPSARQTEIAHPRRRTHRRGEDRAAERACCRSRNSRSARNSASGVCSATGAYLRRRAAGSPVARRRIGARPAESAQCIRSGCCVRIAATTCTLNPASCRLSAMRCAASCIAPSPSAAEREGGGVSPPRSSCALFRSRSAGKRNE